MLGHMPTQKPTDASSKTRLKPSQKVPRAKPRISNVETLAEKTKLRAKEAEHRFQKAKARAQSFETQTQKRKSTKVFDTAKRESEAKKAEAEALMAGKKAKSAEIEGRRATTKAEAHAHKAKCETGMAEECARQAATLPEVLAKYLACKAEAEVKRKKANDVKAKSKSDVAFKEKASEARKNAQKSESEAKKAKIIADEAAAAATIRIRHVEAASKATLKEEIYRIDAQDRMAEALARKAEANARRAEAKAWRTGDILKAEAQKAEAQSKKAEAIAIKTAIDLRRIEKKAKVAARARAALEGLPHPPRKKHPEVCPETSAQYAEKKHLSATGLLNQVRKVFSQISGEQNTQRKGPKSKISICDCLMSGLAIFGLKYPSLLQFEHDSQEGGPIHHNLKSLYQVQQVPCDTYLRECLDDVNSVDIRPAYKKIFAAFQRGKGLEKYEFYDGHYLVLGDGTEYYSSQKVHCDNCCRREHKDGKVTYYHQMMTAVIAHPDHATVIPFCPEPVIKGDGMTKNDCERNASERLYRHIRREHPHLKLIVTEDGIGSNGPHILLLNELEMGYILVVKPDGNKSLFDFIKGCTLEKTEYRDGEYRVVIQFVNNVPLNDTYPDLHVNFFEARVYDGEGNQIYYNTWITGFTVTKNNAYCLYRGGRAKWKIENEAFNTIKNQGYNFEHNYGHGKHNLSTVFALLMMLAFLIDQLQQACCGLFQEAWKGSKTKVRLWARLRAYFMTWKINSWEDLWRAIASGHVGALEMLQDTS